MIISTPLPIPLPWRGELPYLFRLTPHPNLPPKGKEHTFLLEILRFAQYDGIGETFRLTTEPTSRVKLRAVWLRLGEGLILDSKKNLDELHYIQR